jgi:hypothetical protein
MRKFTLAAVAALILASSTFASTWYAMTDRFGYTGTVTKYATLSDAQAGTNGTSASIGADRDMAVFILNDHNAFGPSYANANVVMSAWYYTGSPTNQNNSFVQLYDQDGSTDTVKTGRWTSSAHDTFEVVLKGSNAGAADTARLWNANSPAGPAAATAGTFLDYEFKMIASGLNGVNSAGFVSAVEEPTAISGHFRGLFQNTAAAYPASNGFYAFDLALNMDSWAFDNRPGEFPASEFGAAAVPTPAALGGGLVLLSGLAMKRRKHAAAAAAV